MAVITISRQLGSHGDEVAQIVAQRLGYRLVDRDLVNEAARRAGAPEMALEVVDILGLLDVHPSQKAQRAYQDAMRQVIEETAAQGNVVIVGRAGCALLAEHQDVLHVRLIAPLEWRTTRLVQTRSITLAAARAQLEASDQSRYNYLYRNHNVDWNDPQLYTLVLNMGKLTVNAATELICLAHTQSVL